MYCVTQWPYHNLRIVVRDTGEGGKQGKVRQAVLREACRGEGGKQCKGRHAE